MGVHDEPEYARFTNLAIFVIFRVALSLQSLNSFKNLKKGSLGFFKFVILRAMKKQYIFQRPEKIVYARVMM